MDTENPVRIDNAGLRSVREIIIVSKMSPFFIALLALVASTFRTRAALQADIVALRHQIAVLQQSAPRRLRLRQSDRLLWILLSRFWSGWRRWLHIVKPDTVVRWHRRAFARYWTWKSRRRPGRPGLAAAIRDLIQQMCQANFLWGAPRIHGELLKLGIEVAPSTVGKYLRRFRNPPSQTWRTFLTNHIKQMASMDFFTVPTATFRVLFVFIVLSHDRRRVMHFNVTDHPSEEWTTQQIREAFPWEAPKYLIRDRDAIFGGEFVCPHEEHGDRRSGHGTAIALAESICGTPDRIDSPRVPGSRHYVEPDVAAADSAKLFSLLREVAHAFSPGERRPGPESRRQTGERSHRGHSSGGRPAPSIPAARCLAGLSRHHIWYVPLPSPRLRLVLSFPQKQTFSSMGRAFRWGNEPSSRVSCSIPASPVI